MEENKRIIILVAIALIVAITAIALNVTDSDIPTIGEGGSPTGAVVGIEIQTNLIEDKLVEEGLQQ